MTDAPHSSSPASPDSLQAFAGSASDVDLCSSPAPSSSQGDVRQSGLADSRRGARPSTPPSPCLDAMACAAAVPINSALDGAVAGGTASACVTVDGRVDKQPAAAPGDGKAVDREVKLMEPLDPDAYKPHFAKVKSSSDPDLVAVIMAHTQLYFELANLVSQYMDCPVTMVIAVLDKSSSMHTKFNGLEITREVYQRNLVEQLFTGAGLEDFAMARSVIGSVIHFGSYSTIIMSPRLEDCCPKCQGPRDIVLTDEGFCKDCKVAGNEFVRLDDIASKPLDRVLSKSFAETFVERDLAGPANGGTNFNEAFGRVKQVVLQYGSELKILHRAKTIPIHYVVLFITDGEDSSAVLRKITIMDGVQYPIVSVIVSPVMVESSKEALQQVSDMVLCSTDFKETVVNVRTALRSAMSRTQRIMVENPHPKSPTHTWIAPKQQVVIHLDPQGTDRPDYELQDIPELDEARMVDVDAVQRSGLRRAYRRRGLGPRTPAIAQPLVSPASAATTVAPDASVQAEQHAEPAAVDETVAAAAAVHAVLGL